MRSNNSRRVVQLYAISSQTSSLLLHGMSHLLARTTFTSRRCRQLIKHVLTAIHGPRGRNMNVTTPRMNVLQHVITMRHFSGRNRPFRVFIGPRVVHCSTRQRSNRRNYLSLPSISNYISHTGRMALHCLSKQAFRGHRRMVSKFATIVIRRRVSRLSNHLFASLLLPSRGGQGAIPRAQGVSG